MKDQSPVLQNELQDAPSSSPPAPTVEPPKQKRGFAVMDRTQVRELARRGGVAAHLAGTAHEFNSDEARTAGRKGGIASHAQSVGRGPRVETESA